MKCSKISSSAVLMISIFITALSGCSRSTSQSGSNTPTGCAPAISSCTSAAGPNAIPTSSTNQIPVYIADSSTTGSYIYFNEPLVSVVVCTPNHTLPSQCQTISNVLLDTGSFGLRVFGSAIASNVQPTQQTISVLGHSYNLAECALFGSGADWGAIQNVDVVWGGQTATNIPIQVINNNFGSMPSGCAAQCPDTDPCSARYNGILGVGMFAQDCGTSTSNPCNSTNDHVNPGNYFGCDSTGCYNAYKGGCGSDGICMFGVPLSQQVVNPIASFSSGFNNGGLLTLPSIAAGGASAVSGTFTLGISSAGNNTPGAGVNVYPADANGMTDYNGSDFITSYNGIFYGHGSGLGSNQTLAFIDSGSNSVNFPSGLSTCSDNTEFYCANQAISTNMQGWAASPPGSPSTAVGFTVSNADTFFNSNFSASPGLAATSTNEFDWGLPFFFNRTVYVGINGTTATINSVVQTGPYWAF